MLGDKVGKRAMAITYKGTQMTAEILTTIIASLIRLKSMPAHGKQSLRKLNLQERQLDSIPVTKADLRSFQRELKSFGIDFAVRKSASEPDTFKVYFKAMDVSQLQNALENYTAKSFKKDNKQKTSIKQKMEEAKKKSHEANEARQQNMMRQKAKGVEER